MCVIYLDCALFLVIPFVERPNIRATVTRFLTLAFLGYIVRSRQQSAH